MNAYKMYRINENEKVIIYRKRTRKGIRYIVTYHNIWDGETTYGIGETLAIALKVAENHWKEIAPKSPNPFSILLEYLSYDVL